MYTCTSKGDLFLIFLGHKTLQSLREIQQMTMYWKFFFLAILFQKTITKDYLEYYDYQPSYSDHYDYQSSYSDRLFISQEKDLESSKLELATKSENILPVFLIGFFGSLLISFLLNTVSISPCYLWILFKANGHICI